MAKDNSTTVLIILGSVILVGGGVAIWYFTTQTPDALINTAKKDAVSSQKAQTALLAAQLAANKAPNDPIKQEALKAAMDAAQKLMQKAASSGQKASGSASSGGGSGSGSNSSNKNSGNPKLTDNGDGTSSDSKGNIYNNADGSYVGTKNANGDIDFANGKTLAANGDLYDAPPNQDMVIAQGVQTVQPNGDLDLLNGQTLTQNGDLYAAPPNEDTVIASGVQTVNTNGDLDLLNGQTLTSDGVLYAAPPNEDTVLATGVQTVNADGTVDIEGGYTLDPNTNTLYDENNNVVATDVTGFDPNSGQVTYTGGNTETIEQINNGEPENGYDVGSEDGDGGRKSNKTKKILFMGIA